MTDVGSATAGVKGWLAAAWRFVGSAPLTFGWLTALLFTTIYLDALTKPERHEVLVHRSTDLYHLATDPLYVLFASLWWLDGKYWTPYLVLFAVFLAPAERWLGKIRWLTVGLTAHVVATYISEGVLHLRIEHHLAPERLVHARDIGVSYFLVGVMAVLAYRIARPWRWIYLAVLVSTFSIALMANPGFTAIGHLSAILVGLCFYPMARRRGGPPWSPARAWGRMRRSVVRGRAA